MMRSRVPELDKVKPNTPLRLDVAAAIVFPDGSMTACGLRKEAGRGRLVIERIAGKDYTTLAAIERMRELCRQNPKVRDCGSEKQDAMVKTVGMVRKKAHHHRQIVAVCCPELGEFIQ